MEELFQKEERFQKHLVKSTHYTLIGPSDFNELSAFIKIVNKLAPPNIFSVSLHDSLSNKNAVRRALEVFKFQSEPMIHVYFKESGNLIGSVSLERYCRDYKINFE